MTPETAAAVRLDGLTHRYGDRLALHDVRLVVTPGTLFGLLGPNGGGKTTLFRILATLMPPTAGTAAVFGFDTVAAPEAVRRRLGVVFQQPALDAELTVLENLRFHAAFYGLRGAEREARIDTLLARFGLAERARSRVGTLSGGLQRRADLARGLLHAPPLLLLDEPTTGLDPAARRAFWEVLDDLRRTEGITFVVATHLLEEAEACDRLALLDCGHLRAEGTPAALKAALGEEALWLETSTPAALAEAVAARFAVPVRRVGNRLQVRAPNAAALLAPLYDAFGGQLTSATLRRPTLEDVFFVHTGRALDGRASEGA